MTLPDSVLDVLDGIVAVPGWLRSGLIVHRDGSPCTGDEWELIESLTEAERSEYREHRDALDERGEMNRDGPPGQPEGAAAAPQRPPRPSPAEPTTSPTTAPSLTAGAASESTTPDGAVECVCLRRLVFATCADCGRWWEAPSADALGRRHFLATGHTVDVDVSWSCRFEVRP